MHIMRAITVTCLLFFVAACENPGLRVLSSPNNGPDDFLVNPTKALEPPANYTDLPTPTLGQGNRVDPTPLEDGIRALGGKPSLSTQGTPRADAALVSHASRHGVTPNVREELAEKDRAFRRHHSRFTQIRLAKKDRYNKAYERFSIDPYAVQKAFRARGIPTPSAP